MLYDNFELLIELSRDKIDIPMFHAMIGSMPYDFPGHLIQKSTGNVNHNLYKYKGAFTIQIMNLIDWVSKRNKPSEYYMLLLDIERDYTYTYGELKSVFDLKFDQVTRNVISYSKLPENQL